MMRARLALCASVLLFAVTGSAETPVDIPRIGRLAGTQIQPRIAAGRDGYLVVWRDFRANGDVYAARLDRQRRLLDPAGIRVASSPSAVAVVAVADGYLIVVSRFCASLDTIFVNADGEVAEASHLADTKSSCVEDVQLASNGESVLAVWSTGEGALLSPNGKDVRVRLSLGTNSGFAAVASDGSGYLVAGFIAVANVLHVSLVPVSGRGDVGESKRIGPFNDATGLSLSSDGTDYLLVVSGRNIRAQRVTADGSANAVAHEIRHRDPLSFGPHVTWNGKLYGIAYATTSEQPAFFGGVSFTRVRGDGEAVPTTATAPQTTEPFSPTSVDVAAAGDDFFVVWSRDQTLEASLVSSASLDRRMLTPEMTIARAAPTQFGAVMTAAGDRFVVVWRETAGDRSAAQLRARLISADGNQIGNAVDVAQLSRSYPVSADVAFDDTNIVIAWSDGRANIRRFTLDLTPIDTHPILITSVAGRVSIDAARGVVVVAWEAEQIHAAVIDTAAAAEPSISEAQLPHLTFANHSPVVVHSRQDFVVMWAHALGPVPFQGFYPDPPEDIVAVRVARNAAADRESRTVVHANCVIASLDAKSGGDDIFVAWIPSPFMQRLSAVLGMLVHGDLTPPGEIALLDSDSIASNVSVATTETGFAAAWRRVDGPLPVGSSIHVSIIDASGRVSSSARLTAVETAYLGNSIAVAAAGGRVFTAYDRVDDSPDAGGVSRVFAQEMFPHPARRRGVGTR